MEARGGRRIRVPHRTTTARDTSAADGHGCQLATLIEYKDRWNTIKSISTKMDRDIRANAPANGNEVQSKRKMKMIGRMGNIAPKLNMNHCKR